VSRRGRLRLRVKKSTLLSPELYRAHPRLPHQTTRFAHTPPRPCFLTLPSHMPRSHSRLAACRLLSTLSILVLYIQASLPGSFLFVPRFASPTTTIMTSIINNRSDCTITHTYYFACAPERLFVSYIPPSATLLTQISPHHRRTPQNDPTNYLLTPRGCYIGALFSVYLQVQPTTTAHFPFCTNGF